VAFSNILAYSGPTTQAELEFIGDVATGVAYSGIQNQMDIQPLDRFGNPQDYTSQLPDEFLVNITANEFITTQCNLTRQIDRSRVPEPVFFRCTFTTTVVGTYKLNAFLRNEGNNFVWEAVGATKSITVLGGQADAQATEVSGQAVRNTQAGATSLIRVTLKDLAGNLIGNGNAQKFAQLAAVANSGRRLLAADPLDEGQLALANGCRLASCSNTSASLPGGRHLLEHEFPQFRFLTAHLVPYLDGVVNPAREPVGLIKEYNQAEQVYYLSFIELVAGTYMLNITIYGEQVSILNYEFTQVSAGDVHTPLCTAEGNGVGTGGTQLPAGVQTSFLIRSFDRFGNERTTGGVVFDTLLRSATFGLTRQLNQLEINQIAVGTRSAEDFYDYVKDDLYFVRPSTAADNSDGTFSVAYTAQVAAFYFVEINRGGVLIKDAPFVVQVKPDVTSGANSLTFCKSINNCGLERVQAGLRSVIFIQARDANGNNKTDNLDLFYFSVVGGGGYSKNEKARPLGPSSPGQYEVTFNAEVAGTLEVVISFGDTTVLQTTVIVIPSLYDAAATTIGGSAIPRTVAGVPADVVVTVRDTYGNQVLDGGAVMTINLQAEGTAVLDTQLLVIDNGDGRYTGKFTKFETANYTVVVTVDRLEVFPAFFTLDSAPLVLENTRLTGLGGATVGPLQAGAEVVLQYIFRDQYFNVRMQGTDLVSQYLDLVVYPPEESALPPQTQVPTITFEGFAGALSEQGQYTVRFTPTRVGELRVTLTVPALAFNEVETLLDPATGEVFQYSVQLGVPNATNSRIFGESLTAAVMMARSVLNVAIFDQYGNDYAADGALVEYDFQQVGVQSLDLQQGIASMKLQDTGVARKAFNTYEIFYTPPTFSRLYNMNITVYIRDAVTQTRVAVPGAFTVTVNGAASFADPEMSTVVGADGMKLVGKPASNRIGNAGGVATIYVQARDVNGLATSTGRDGFPLTAAWLTASILPVGSAAPAVGLTGIPGRFSVSFTETKAQKYYVRVNGAGRDGVPFPIAGNWAGSIRDALAGEVIVEVSGSVQEDPLALQEPLTEPLLHSAAWTEAHGRLPLTRLHTRNPC
jgi:hypothetical protein